MKRFACLLLMAVLLLSGCQLVEQTVPTQTEPIEYEHYFFKELCYCTLGPEKPFREQPNYLQYTKEIWEELEELLPKKIALELYNVLKE